jgi:hypothetical protein
MRRALAWLAVGLMACAVLVFAQTKATPEWSLNATIIEACSCPMFCQCYFNAAPSAHHSGGHGEAAEHFCRFNNAFKVTKGNYGTVKLEGAKFWVAGDLGGDFSKGQMDWATLTFDPSVTKEQREGITAIMGRLYPVKWNSFTVVKDGAMEWKFTKDRAEARLDGGKTAEVVLNRNPGMTDDPVEQNPYWGAPQRGFAKAKRGPGLSADKAFEFKGTNGFMITFDINSKDTM